MVGNILVLMCNVVKMASDIRPAYSTNNNVFAVAIIPFGMTQTRNSKRVSHSLSFSLNEDNSVLVEGDGDMGRQSLWKHTDVFCSLAYGTLHLAMYIYVKTCCECNPEYNSKESHILSVLIVFLKQSTLHKPFGISFPFQHFSFLEPKFSYKPLGLRFRNNYRNLIWISQHYLLVLRFVS